MNSSRTQSGSGKRPTSTANRERVFAAATLFDEVSAEIPGSYDDSSIVRGVLIDAIRTCNKSREQIAEDMSFALGREVTVRQINAWTAESREDYRFPAEYDRAFCLATGDDRLLRCRAELAGYKLITDTEVDLLELGRQYLIQKRAAEQVELLEKRLAGVNL